MRQGTLSALLSAVALLHGIAGQGDAAAAVAGTKNNPKKPWRQWQPKPMYKLNELPIQYMGKNPLSNGGEDQYGWNSCANNTWSQQSKCQTAWINSIDDFCLWGPPEPGPIASTERIAVAYCTLPKHGTRLIPDGTLQGVHFLKTASYIQVSGPGDFRSIGIPDGDEGGEMDSAGADDLSNPIGGIYFSTAVPNMNGQPTQIAHWSNFMSYNQYCLRACWGPDAEGHCQHIYDVMGCKWNMPSVTGYDADIFESCEGDVAPFQGVYDNGTFHQGDPITPEAHPAAASSNCQTATRPAHGLIAAPQPLPNNTGANQTRGSTPGTPVVAPVAGPTPYQQPKPKPASGSPSSAHSMSIHPLGGLVCIGLAIVAGAGVLLL